MTIKVIIFESALELIPESSRNHPLVRNEWRFNTKKKNRGVLLDRAIHNPLMGSLYDSEKRGRPDIVYYSLLNLLYSPIVKQGLVEVIIHTYTNHCILIPSFWRIPVNYNRFVGLMSQLLLKNQIPVDGEPILTVSKSNLAEILHGYDKSQFFMLESPNKDSILVKELYDLNIDNSVFLIGGFQAGEPSILLQDEIIEEHDFEFISLYPEVKPAWVITSKLVHLLEDRLRQ
jgi:rRNA small subunit pseudouridine methyltransferase Nep1